MTTVAAIQQQRRRILTKIAQETAYPKILTQQDLYAKITAACTEIGIDDIVIRDWKKNTYGTGFTEGVIRQQQYDTHQNKNSRAPHDIAYFVNESKHPQGTYNTNMVHINYDAFSDERGKQFTQALNKQGLHPSKYQNHDSSGIGLTTEEIQQRQTRREQTRVYI